MVEVLSNLDPRLEADSTFILNLDLCQVRLSHNAAFPWILLIPNRPNVREIIDLGEADRGVLMEEIAKASQVMRSIFTPTKLNVAALGNIVPQLHVHIIARYDNDAAWPGSVWGTGVEKDYDDAGKIQRMNLLHKAFSG